MVFYTDASWRDACYAHWDDEVAEEDKARWVAFLKGLRYDGDDRELCVNELQAYMCTERLLFGGRRERRREREEGRQGEGRRRRREGARRDASEVRRVRGRAVIEPPERGRAHEVRVVVTWMTDACVVMSD